MRARREHDGGEPVGRPRRAGGGQDPTRARGRADGSDRGTSLVEVLVVMGLMGLIGTLVMTLSISTAKALRGADERGADTQQVRVALEAVTRALRSAVDPDGAAPAGSVCAATGTAGQQCAFLGTSAAAVLQSGPRRLVVWSAAHDLSATSPSPAPTSTDLCAATDPTGVDGHRAPRLVKYELTPAGELTEQTWTRSQYLNGCVGTVQPRTRVLARGLDASSSAFPVFSYLSEADARKSHDVGTEKRSLPRTGPMTSSLTDPSGVLQSPLLEPGDVGRIAAVEVYLSAVHRWRGRPVSAVDSVALTNDPEVTLK